MLGQMVPALIFPNLFDLVLNCNEALACLSFLSLPFFLSTFHDIVISIIIIMMKIITAFQSIHHGILLMILSLK